MVAVGLEALRRGIKFPAHSITQHPPPSPFSNVSKAALVAASKTSSTPSPVNDEHSRYFRAPISCAISSASCLPTKCCDLFRTSSIASGSSRKSFFKPTSMIGTLGHLSLASSTHYYYVSLGLSGILQINPLCVWRCLENLGYQLKIRWELRVLSSMQEVVIFRSLLVLQYPIMPIVHSFHPPCSPSHNFRIRLVPENRSVRGESRLGYP